ncbi:MAG: hypothetical protein BroJett011_53810 [Chloroflexota bacterium]|nr:MAG: hypothetical protein BroJett011_53810 [Chloroflexota bacterium]
MSQGQVKVHLHHIADVGYYRQVVSQGQIGYLLPLGNASQPHGIGLHKMDSPRLNEIAKIIESIELLA